MPPPRRPVRRHPVGPGMPPPPPPRGRAYGGYRRRGSCGGLAVLLVLIVILVVMVGFRSCSAGPSGAWQSYGSSSSNSQSSTIVREKIDSGNAYINNCIIDELGWFDSISKTESRLKDFWEETGVQPYIILKAYDETLTTEAEKEQWALDCYDANFDTENIFLYVYFAEADADNDVGYMAYANGEQTFAVMDSEAVEIFWNNIDEYWYTNLSTDDVFVNAFNDTAETIMYVSTTGLDIVKWVLIILAIILIGAVVVILVRQKHQRAREKAEEDQKILNTPIHDIAKDDLEDKYL